MSYRPTQIPFVRLGIGPNLQHDLPTAMISLRFVPGGGT